MRSLAVTLALTLAATLLGSMAVWQWRQGNFHAVFGVPPTAVGQRLYDSFQPGEVKHIRISGGGGSASFSLGAHGWQADSPWADRMDPRAAVSIINFTLGMRVEDLAQEDEIAPMESGLGDAAIKIRLEDAGRRPLAKYQLGRVTPWKAEVEGIGQPVPTVFIRPADQHRTGHVFICTGDINPLFKDGLKFLRDHRPFYFNPLQLGKIRIRSQQGDLTLGRETPESPWRIVKPLDLPTDPAAMKALLEGLFELRAVRVSDRAAVTMPAAETAVKPCQIAISPFGSETETLLEVSPPASPDAQHASATVSNRPNTLFELALKPEPGIVSLADLPLGVNDLRDPTLTRLNIASLRTIVIQSATGPEILISREPKQPWMTAIDGVRREANEENMFALLKAVTTGRATAFESDAATDFTPWGLDRPILTLRLIGSDNQALVLRFGINAKGAFFANRLGAPTVMRVEESLINSIAVRPYEWRHSRLWSLNRVNLVGIEHREANNPPVVLKYKFIDESWQASREGRDIGASLDPVRANHMLSVLEGLKVSRWLSTADDAAAAALANPSLAITIIEKTVDEAGDFSGLSQRTLSLAPAKAGPHSGLCYGRLSSETHPFLLDSTTCGKLAADLFGK
jgi:hypothetical protein